MEFTPLTVAMLAGLGGMFGWGFADLFAKRAIDAVGALRALVVSHLFGSGVFVLGVLGGFMFMPRAFAWPQGMIEWGSIVLFGMLQAAVYVYLFRAFSVGPVSILSPLFSTFAVCTALVSVVFFGEPWSLILVVALAVIFFGIVCMGTDASTMRMSSFRLANISGIREITIAVLLATVWTLGWNYIVGGHDWLPWSMSMYVVMSLTLLVYARLQGVAISVGKSSLLLVLFCVGFFEVFAYASVTWGYSVTTYTSVVAMISSGLALPAMIGARLWLGERIGLLQLLGGVCVVVGVVLVALQ